MPTSAPSTSYVYFEGEPPARPYRLLIFCITYLDLLRAQRDFWRGEGAEVRQAVFWAGDLIGRPYGFRHRSAGAGGDSLSTLIAGCPCGFEAVLSLLAVLH